MTVLEKLKRRAKELDHKLIILVGHGSYDYQAADDRELLEAAIRCIERPKLHVVRF